MLIQSAYNLDTLSGLVRLTIRILKVTLCLEGLGASTPEGYLVQHLSCGICLLQRRY